MAGDTVVVRPGAYAGFALGWDQPRSGLPDAPITFKADAGATITSRNSKSPDGINLESASYVVIDGFTIKADTIAPGIRCVQARGVVLRNNVINGAGRWGIYASHCDGIRIEQNTAANSAKEHGIYVCNSVADAVILGNRVFGNRGSGIHLNGDLSQGAPGVMTRLLIQGNVIYANGRSGGSAINGDGVRSFRHLQ